jgi:hypothetical protein
LLRRERDDDEDERERVRLRALVRPDGADGTFSPRFRASDSPMAIACLRLVTRLPERPERNFPFFISRITR